VATTEPPSQVNVPVSSEESVDGTPDLSQEAQQRRLADAIRIDQQQLVPQQAPVRSGDRMTDAPTQPRPNEAAAREYVTDVYNKQNDVNERNPVVTGGKMLWNTISNDLPAALYGTLASGAFMGDDTRGIYLTDESRKAARELRQANDQLRQEGRKFAAKESLAYQEASAKFTDDLVKSISQVKDPLDGLNYVFGVLGQTTAQIPLSVGTGGASSVMQGVGPTYLGGVKKIAQEKGITIDEVMDKGLDEPLFSLIYGTISGSLERFGAGKVMNAFSKEALKQSMRSRAKEIAVSGGLVEPLTEYAQTALEQLGEEQTAGKGFTESVKDVATDPDKSKARIESFVAGLVGGIGLGAIGSAIPKKNDNNQSTTSPTISEPTDADVQTEQPNIQPAGQVPLVPTEQPISEQEQPATPQTREDQVSRIESPAPSVSPETPVSIEEDQGPDIPVDQKSGEIVPRVAPASMPTTDPDLDGIKNTLIQGNKLDVDEKGNVTAMQNSGAPSQLFNDLEQITGDQGQALNQYLRIKDDQGEFKKKFGDWENSIMKDFGRSGGSYTVKKGVPPKADKTRFAWVAQDKNGNPVVRFNEDKLKREQDFGTVKTDYQSQVVSKESGTPAQKKQYQDLYNNTINKLRDLKLHLIHQALIRKQKGNVTIEDNIRSIQEIQRLNDIPLAKDYYGEPMIFMHGGDKNISRFKKPGEKGYVANDIMTGSAGIYFTRSPKGVKYYSGFSEKPAKGKDIYYTFLKTKNPYYMTDPKAQADYPIGSSETISKRDVDALRAKGYDSIIWDKEGTPKKEVVVFDPDQIEIIGSFNQGLQNTQNREGEVAETPNPQASEERRQDQGNEGRQELLSPAEEQQPSVETTPSAEEPAPQPTEFGYQPGDIAAGTDVQFYWPGFGRDITGKVVGYKNGRIKMKGKDGIIYTKDPKDVKPVNQDVKAAKPKSDENIVGYNSRRKKPIGIVSNGKTGPDFFGFHIDMPSVVSTFKKLFTSKGFLPQEVFNRWIKTKGEIGKYESQIRFTLGDIKKAIKEEYGGKKPTDDQITDLNLALSGKQPMNPIPPKTLSLIDDMRAQIDNLSHRFIDEGIISGDLVATFTKNLGTYLTRSHRKFDDSFWAEFVPDEVKNKAEALIRREFPNYSTEEIQGLINEIMYSPNAPGALLKGSKLGSKDLSILKKRSDIAPEIRALMGEYGDPLLNYARTITKMANLVAKHHFLEDVRSQGMNNFLFEKPIGNYFVKIAAEGSKTMAPLNGLYTTKEIAQAFEEFNAMEPMPGWIKAYMKVNAYIKAGKTVFSVMTHARNIFGNFGFVVMNAHYRADKAGKAIQTAFANVYSNADWKKIREKFKEYIELGVIQDSGAAGELRNYLEDIKKGEDFFEKINDNKIKKIRNAVLDTTQNMYQFEDDLFKIYAYENEYARYKKAFPDMDDQQVKDKAAEIVRNTYPTYSMVPKIVKAFRANPLVGTFVSFPAEVLRTTYNTIALAKEEMANPSTRSIGAQRTAGIMAAALLPTAASYATMALLGLDGQDDEDLRKFVAPWQKNSEYLYMGVDGDKYRIIDMGYSDPHSYLKRPVYDLLKGSDLERSVIESVSSLAEPFLTEELLAERLIDWARNQKKTGDHVYNPDSPLGDKAADTWHHMQVAIEPGTVASLRRILKAAEGDTDKYGNKYELTNELVGLVSGQKQEVKDVSQALLFRAYELKDRADLTEKELSRVRYNKTTTPEDLADAQRKHDAAMEVIAQDALDIYHAAIRLGVDPKEAKKTMYRTKSAVIVKKIKQ
jgi:hypothetical protein